MQSQNEKTFKTSSRALAAFLRAKQIPVEIVPNPRRANRVDFIAPATDTTYKAILAFNQNEFVEIQTFIECLDEITDRMKDLVRSRAAEGGR